jgi:DNA polymerase (family 10)
MDKWGVARALDEIATYLELSEPNRFKSLAFERAGKALTTLDRDLQDLVASRDLYKTAGIGERTGAVIEELLRTGQSRYLDELRKQYPPGIFELLRVPGLGLKKIGILFQKLGIGSLDQLEAACRANRLTTLRGFGAKTQQKILDGIEKARRNESRFLLPAGIETAETLRERLASIDRLGGERGDQRQHTAAAGSHPQRQYRHRHPAAGARHARPPKDCRPVRSDRYDNGERRGAE